MEKKHSLSRSISIIVGIFFICLTGSYISWLGTYKFHTVDSGRVYRSAAIPPEVLPDVIEKRGIRTVIDFRNTIEDVLPEKEVLESLGVNHVHLPTEQVPDMHWVEKFLDVMDRPESYPVLIHCRHGIGRTGVFVALYRIEYENWTNDEARREQWWFRAFMNFQEDSSKGSFIMAYEAREKAQLELAEILHLQEAFAN